GAGMNVAEPAIAPVAYADFERDFEGFSRALGGSFARYGFAVIQGHGLPQAQVEAAIGAAKAFFALPEAVKRAYVVGLGGQRGYTPFGVETAKDAAHADLKEFWHVGRDLPPGHRYAAAMDPNVWPAEVADFRREVGWLYGALDAMGGKLLEAIAAYLGLPRGFFAPIVSEGNSVLRLLHYPP